MKIISNRDVRPATRYKIFSGQKYEVGSRFVRYADDFIVLVKSWSAGERVIESLKRFLERTLKLKVNLDKSRVVPINQVAFLGFTFRGTKICWSGKAFREFKRRVKELTGRSWFTPWTIDTRSSPNTSVAG